MDDRIDIASATGVDLHLNIAGPGARSYAFVIDWHIRLLLALAWLAIVALIVFGEIGFMNRDGFEFNMPAYFVLVPPVAIYFLYHPVLEILMKGSTPGKRMAGVRIVTTDGEIPGILAHLIRNVLRLLDSLPTAYVVGLTSAVITRNSVRIGDLAAGTVLIYDTDSRDNRKHNAPVGLGTGLSIAQAELVQDVLDRWEQLEDDKRCALANRLMQQLRPDIVPAASGDYLKLQLEQLLAGDSAT